MNYLTRVNFLLTVHLLVLMMHILICSIYSMRNVYFMKRYHQKKHVQVSFHKKVYQDAVLVSFTETPPDITTSTHTGGFPPHHQVRRKVFPQNYVRNLVLLTVNVLTLE